MLLVSVLLLLAVSRADVPYNQFSQSCQQDALNFINALSGNSQAEGNALQLLASTATYPGDLGKYFQCTLTYGAEYCTVSYKFPKTNTTVVTGFCIPNGCNATDAAMLAADFFSLFDYDNLDLNKLIVLFIAPFTLHGAAAIFTVILISFLTFLVLVASAKAYLTKPRQPEAITSEANHTSINTANEESKPLLAEPTKKKKHSLSYRLLEAFDIAPNWHDLNKSPAINQGLKALDGLRVLSMMWIILSHTFLHIETNSIDEVGDARVYQATFAMQMPFNGTYAVDSFFFLSAFLACYLFIDAFKKQKAAEQASGKKKREPNIVAWSSLVYFHRYLRLTPLYFVAIMFYTYVIPLVANGPYWASFTGTVDSDAPCHRYWWTNMLYVNNMYPNQFGGTAQGGLGCMSWTWYLATDTQLFLVLPLLAKFYMQSRRGAYITTIALVIIGLGIRGGLTYWYNLQACIGTVGAQNALNTARDQTVVYNKPYTRATPYLFGILLAYYYSDMGGAKHTKPLHISRPIVVSLWLATAAAMLACVYGSYGMETPSGLDAGECVYDRAQNFFSITFGTVGWSAGVTFIVFAGLFGYGGWVTKILANDVFNPLGRLVYGAYLVHPMLMYVLDFSQDQKVELMWYPAIAQFCGVAVLAFGTSLLGHLIVEKPLNNIQKIILPAGR